MLIETILIIIILVIAGFCFIKVNSISRKIKLVFVSGILIFLIVTISSIININNIQLNSIEGYIKLSSVYLQWLADFGKDSIRLTGNAIKSISSMFR